MDGREWVAEYNEEALCCDGADEAIVGICHQFGRPPVAVYDLKRYIQILVDGGMTEEEAEEYWSFNVVGAWMGEGTPVFIEFMEPNDASP